MITGRTRESNAVFRTQPQHPTPALNGAGNAGLSRGGTTRSWESTNATATIAPETAGCLLREEYHGERFGLQYDYVALCGANGLSTGSYQRVFAHSQHGLMVLREGDFAGGTLQSNVVVHGERVTEEDRITRPDSARFTLTNRRSSDDGLTWTVTRRATYSRVGGKE